jgi:hypothetical protein
MIELRPTPKTPQGDPDGDNRKRADWARLTVLYFQRQTRTEDSDALSDLLCDLMHLCDYTRGFEFEEFEPALDRARDHYEAETMEDGNA